MTSDRCKGRLVSGSFPRSPVPAVGQPGTVVRISRARVVWLWGPATGPTASALASWRCALWGWWEGIPGGDASRHCEGSLGSGAGPPSAARPKGGQSGSAAHVLWARVCGRGGPALSLWRACPARGCVLRGWREAVLEGGSPLRVLWGVWCQALSLTRPPVPGGGQPGFVDRVFRAQVVWAWPPSSSGPTGCALASRPCALCGWREGVPGGGVPRVVVRGVSGQALVLLQLPVLGAGRRGPLPRCSGRRCARGERHCPLGVHALRGAARRGVGGRSSRGG